MRTLHRAGLAFLICSLLPAPAWAQRTQLFTIFVREGGQVVKLLVEKRGDLLVGVVSGAIVAAGDHAMQAIFGSGEAHADSPPAKNCQSISDEIKTCEADVPVQGLKPANQDDIERALQGVQTNFLVNPHPLPLIGTKTDLVELTDWWSIQNSTNPDDYRTYLERYPLGSHAIEARLRQGRYAALAPVLNLPVRPSQPVCSNAEEEVLKPIRAAQEALANRDLDSYADQWLEPAIFRSYDNSFRYNKATLVDNVRNSLQRWSSIHMGMTSYRITANEDGTMNVRDAYWFDMSNDNGDQSSMNGSESYTIACASGGAWKIFENVDYAQQR